MSFLAVIDAGCKGSNVPVRLQAPGNATLAAARAADNLRKHSSTILLTWKSEDYRAASFPIPVFRPAFCAWKQTNCESSLQLCRLR